MRLRRCRCPQCPFWRAVLARAYADRPPDLGGHRRGRRSGSCALRALPRLLRAHGRRRRAGAAATGTPPSWRASTARSPSLRRIGRRRRVEAGQLRLPARRVDGLDVHVLHLVRDPRGVAHSWRRGARLAPTAATASLRWAARARSRAPCCGTSGTPLRRAPAGADPAALRPGAVRGLRRRPVRALRPVLAMVGSTRRAAGRRRRHGAPRSYPHRGRQPEPDDDRRRSARRRRRVGDRDAGTAAGCRHRGHRAAAAPLRLPAAARREGRGRHPRRRRRTGRACSSRTCTAGGGCGRGSRRNVAVGPQQGLRRVLEEKEIDPLRTVPAAVRKWRLPPHEPGAARALRCRCSSSACSAPGTNMLRARARQGARGRGAQRERPARLRPVQAALRRRHRGRSSRAAGTPTCCSSRCATRTAPTTCSTTCTPHAPVGRCGCTATSTAGCGPRSPSSATATGRCCASSPTARTRPAGTSSGCRRDAELVRSFDYDAMTPASGAALMWLIRNRLYFELGLDRATGRAPGVATTTSSPTRTRPCAGCAAFLDFPYDPALVGHVTARPPVLREPLDIDPRIRDACDDLGRQLVAASRARARASG